MVGGIQRTVERQVKGRVWPRRDGDQVQGEVGEREEDRVIRKCALKPSREVTAYIELNGNTLSSSGSSIRVFTLLSQA